MALYPGLIEPCYGKKRVAVARQVDNMALKDTAAKSTIVVVGDLLFFSLHGEVFFYYYFYYYLSDCLSEMHYEA